MAKSFQRNRYLGRKALLAVAVIAAISGGCGTSGDRSDETKTGIQPVELTEITPTVQVQKLWSRSVGGGVSDRHLKLKPQAHQGRVFAANRAGEVSAYDAASGDPVWQADTGLEISGGPGVGHGLVVVGSFEGEVSALAADTGATVWQTLLSSEVLSAPAIAAAVVVVRTIDGKLFGLDKNNGERLWVYDRTVPVLTLRGTASPVLANGSAVNGFDNGMLVAVALEDGQRLWETRIAEPRGRSELERLVDLDADPVVDDGTVYAVSFQGRVAAIDGSTGGVLWQRDMSSYAGLSVDRRMVYVTDDKSHVWALNRSNSQSAWRQTGLEGRKLTSPASFGSYVVAGDLEGYVHWLHRDDGHLAARVRTDSSGIIAAPTVFGDTLYVYARDGTLAAYRIAANP